MSAILTPGMIPFIRATVAQQQAAYASGRESDRYSSGNRWMRQRLDCELPVHDRRTPRALRVAVDGTRRSRLVVLANANHAANLRKTRLYDACRGKRPDLECVFVRHKSLVPKLGSTLILMWLPPAEVAMARLAGWEVYPG